MAPAPGTADYSHGTNKEGAQAEHSLGANKEEREQTEPCCVVEGRLQDLGVDDDVGGGAREEGGLGHADCRQAQEHDLGTWGERVEGGGA